MSDGHVAVTGSSSAGKDIGKDLQGIRGQLDGLAKAGQAAGIALGAREVIQYGREALSMGLRAERSAVALDAMTGSAMTNAQAVAAVKGAVRGSISDLEAQAVAARLLSIGMADSTESIARFTEASATLGQAFRGLDADESVQLFSQMLSNRSVKLLDDFGIGISEVKAQMEAMGSTGQEAFQLATIDIAIQKAQELGGIWETNATEIAKFGANMENIKTSLGTFLGDTFGHAAEGANAMFGGLEAIQQGSEAALDTWIDNERALQNLGMESGQLGMSYLDLAKAGDSMQKAFDQMPFPVQQAGLAMAAQHIAMQRGLPIWAAYGEAVDLANTDMEAFVQTLLDAQIFEEAMERGPGRTPRAVGAARDDFVSQGPAPEVATTIEDVASAWEHAAQAAAEYATEVDHQAQIMAGAMGMFDDLPDSVAWLGKSFTSFSQDTEWAETFGAEVEWLDGTIENLQGSIEEAGFEANAFQSTWDDDTIANAAEDVEALNEALQAATARRTEIGDPEQGEGTTSVMTDFDPEAAAAVGNIWMETLSNLNVSQSALNELINQTRLNYGLVTPEVLAQEAALQQLGLLVESNPLFNGMAMQALDMVAAGFDNASVNVSVLSELLREGRISTETFAGAMQGLADGTNNASTAQQVLSDAVATTAQELGLADQAYDELSDRMAQREVQQLAADMAAAADGMPDVTEAASAMEAFFDVLEGAPPSVETEFITNASEEVLKVMELLQTTEAVPTDWDTLFTEQGADDVMGQAEAVSQAVLSIPTEVTISVNIVQSGEIPNIPGHGQAQGGRVSSGEPTVVGEHGPEIFVPSTSGQIKNEAAGAFNNGNVMNYFMGNVIIGEGSDGGGMLTGAAVERQTAY